MFEQHTTGKTADPSKRGEARRYIDVFNALGDKYYGGGSKGRCVLCGSESPVTALDDEGFEELADSIAEHLRMHLDKLFAAAKVFTT